MIAHGVGVLETPLFVRNTLSHISVYFTNSKIIHIGIIPKFSHAEGGVCLIFHYDHMLLYVWYMFIVCHSV